MQYANPLNLSVKGLKTWDTHDGGGYQFTLVQAGAAIARVTNEGNGGMLLIEAASKFGERVLTELRAFCATLPKDTTYGEPIDISDEIYIEELVSDAEEQKRFNKILVRAKKHSTCFTLKTDTEPLAFRTVKSLNAAGVCAMLDKKYGVGSYTVL